MYAKIYNLQLASKTLNFITKHKISDLAELADAVGDLYGEQIMSLNAVSYSRILPRKIVIISADQETYHR
jgi:hypothetical protein